MKLPPALFITGTDTNVGKTIVCAILLRGLNACYWKPIQAGMDPTSDTDTLKQITGLPAKHFLPEQYVLSQPMSPHAAAQIDGVEIDMQSISLPNWDPGKRLIVEGAGGLMVPLNCDKLVIDLIAHLQIPTLLVARSTLGTINHTLLSLEQLQRRRIDVLGVVMNGPINASNRQAIEYYGGTKVIAEVETLPALDEANLLEAFNKYFEVDNDGINPRDTLSDLAPVHANENSARAPESAFGGGSLSRA
jgi:dethiobiotin synthetase